MFIAPCFIMKFDEPHVFLQSTAVDVKCNTRSTNWFGNENRWLDHAGVETYQDLDQAKKL